VSGGYITGRKGAGTQVGDAYHWYCAEAKMNAAKLRFAFCHHEVQIKIRFFIKNLKKTKRLFLGGYTVKQMQSHNITQGMKMQIYLAFTIRFK
jgi:hypothetical protein